MERASYRIIVRGRLTDRLAASFDGMATEAGDGETALVGRVRDQAHRCGLVLLRVEEGAQ